MTRDIVHSRTEAPSQGKGHGQRHIPKKRAVHSTPCNRTLSVRHVSAIVLGPEKVFHESESKSMLTYKAMYKYLDKGVHAEVLDFPGAISWGKDLEEARRLLASALVDMAETNLLRGEPLPQPAPARTDPDADLEEPLHLLLKATSRVSLVPQDAGS